MRKNIGLFILLLMSVLLITPDAMAVNSSKSAEDDDKNETLEKIMSMMPKVSGYLQTGWNYTSNDEKSTSSFQAKRLRLILDGNVSSNIDFRLQIEAFNGISGTRNGRGQKNLQVMDAFATWKIRPEFKIRAGQFYMPIGFENYDISPATLETVDFSNIVYRMVTRNPISYDYIDYGRDLGVMIMGDLLPSDEGFNYLSYDVALTNGALPAKDDNNKSKDFIASLRVRPMKHLMLKGSFNWGEYAQEFSDNLGQYQSMNRFIVGAWYNNPKGLDLRAEFGKIKSDSDIKIDETGAYVLAGWHAGKWLPVVRWDMYEDAENEYTGNNYNRILAGVSYQVTNNFKLQANYNHKMYTDEAEEALGYDSDNQLQIMALFKF